MTGPNFGVYAECGRDATGCFYYRVEVPLRGLQKLGLSKICIDKGKGLTPTERGAVIASSDILLMYAASGDARAHTMKTVGSMKAGIGLDGTMEYPPSVVFDMDDNIDYVHPLNPAFVGLGTRNWDGKLLNQGDQLNITLEDGTDIVLWEDRKTINGDQQFDIERNHNTVWNAHKMARSAEGVTLASSFLTEYYKTVVDCDHVYHFPNSVIPEDYPIAKLAPRTDGSVRILWQGGASHMPDLTPIRGALKDICLKYSNVKIVMWGQEFPWILNNIPPQQLEFMPWMGYDGYKAHRTLVDIDINLCPLVDNIFNRSKSCIKWYEASILSRPEATLAAKVRPYSEEMVDGETGLLYETPQDFFEKLCVLVEKAELRQELGERAKRWVLENRHYEKTVPGLFEFYQEIRARKRANTIVTTREIGVA